MLLEGCSGDKKGTFLDKDIKDIYVSNAVWQNIVEYVFFLEIILVVILLLLDRRSCPGPLVANTTLK